jgi:uncharacterized membrane protein HdeD (DUF308 family)
MGPFILDLVLGILFIISASVTVIGFLAFRQRREIGPVLLMISGFFGITASILLVLSRSNAVELSDWLPLSIFALSILSFLLSIILWRSRR